MLLVAPFNDILFDKNLTMRALSNISYAFSLQVSLDHRGQMGHLVVPDKREHQARMGLQESPVVPDRRAAREPTARREQSEAPDSREPPDWPVSRDPQDKWASPGRTGSQDRPAHQDLPARPDRTGASDLRDQAGLKDKQGARDLQELQVQPKTLHGSTTFGISKHNK